MMLSMVATASTILYPNPSPDPDPDPGPPFAGEGEEDEEEGAEGGATAEVRELPFKEGEAVEEEGAAEEEEEEEEDSKSTGQKRTATAGLAPEGRATRGEDLQARGRRRNEWREGGRSS